MLEIRLFQTPQVQREGELVVFPYQRAQALLYYMLVQRSATRQELAALLWEDFELPLALKNLRNTLYTLKKVLGSEFLISPQRSVVVLNPACCYRCDYDLLQQGELSAYTGEFLRGFSLKNAEQYAEWLNATRTGLRRQYLGCRASAARAALTHGNAEDAARLAEEYLREEPLDEAMNAFLMSCLRGQRQYAKAAQLYQDFKQNLGRELGAAPLESTTGLYYDLMREWGETMNSGTAAAPAAKPERQTFRACELYSKNKRFVGE